MSVYISRGMRLSIPAGALKFGVDANGENASSVTVQVGIALFPMWLEIALHHLRESAAANSALVSSLETRDAEVTGRSLEAEFSHGMQSITASATAVEAFYAQVRAFDSLSEDEVAAMRANRTSRPTRIKETLRRVFCIEPKFVPKLGEALTGIYRFRDWAVHPPADQRNPILHPIRLLKNA